MTIQEALRYDFERLKKAGIDSYQLDTEILLAKTLFHPKQFITPLAPLILRGELNSKIQTFLKYAETIDRRNLLKLPLSQKLTPSQLQIFKTLIERRQKRIPLAYLTNVKEFYGLPFYVDERVLIPRPQTEGLVKSVLQQTTMEQWNNGIIIDIGTGSGCIIISIAKHLKNDYQLVATDTSPEALRVARLNAQIYGVADCIRFIKTDTLPSGKTENLIIVSNLPYLDAARKKYFYKKSPELQYEPQSALFAKEKGFFSYRKLFEKISNSTSKHLFCVYEIEPNLTAKLKSLISTMSFSTQKRRLLSSSHGIIAFKT